MGILKRFKDIMSSNINALLDKAEDPAKMVDQYLRDLQDDLGKVKAETAAVMAAEKRAEREAAENREEIARLEGYAEKALLAGNEEDAKVFLSKKAALDKKQEALDAELAVAKENASQMRQMHDKLEKDISELKERKEAIKAKMQLAKTKKRVSEIGSSYKGTESSMAAFDRMEEKANQMLDEANAMVELNTDKKEDAESLMDKYDEGKASTDAAVESDLAALKAKLGME